MHLELSIITSMRPPILGYIDPVKFETPSAVLEFDANISNRDVFNAIAGHANGSDIHPYTIKLLPILIY